MMKRILLAFVVALAAGCGQPTPTNDPCKGRLAGDFVVTEVMIDPDGTDTGSEYFEIFNTTGSAIDLKGMTLYTRDTDGSGAKSHVVLAGSAPAHGYFTFGDVRSGPNPAWIGYSYKDGLGSFGNQHGVVGIRCGATTLAEYTWTTAGKSGRSRMLGGPDAPTAALAAEPANFCDTPTSEIYFGANAGTPGAANPKCQAEAASGTCVENGAVRPLVAPQPGDLVITEVMTSPSASSDTTGEWLEVLASASVDLNDLAITTTTSSTHITSQACIRAEPGQYLLLARSGDAFVNGDLPAPDYVYGSISFADSSNQRIGLFRGDAGIDEIALTPAQSGHAWQLDPLKLDPASNDDPANFCHAPNKWNPDGGGDYGSPKAGNPDCPVVDSGVPVDPSACIDPVSGMSRSRRVPVDGDLVLSELMADPAAVSDANGEYVELFVKSDVDLNGVALQVGSSKTTLNSATCLGAAAGSYVVLGKNTSPAVNGNLPPLLATFTGSLVNGGATLTLLAPDGGTFDTLTYAAATAGASTQVDVNFLTPTDNDAHLCITPVGVQYGMLTDAGVVVGDRGTPGAANVACP